MEARAEVEDANPKDDPGFSCDKMIQVKQEAFKLSTVPSKKQMTRQDRS
jgi:hypothetical protein